MEPIVDADLMKAVGDAILEEWTDTPKLEPPTGQLSPDLMQQAGDVMLECGTPGMLANEVWWHILRGGSENDYLGDDVDIDRDPAGPDCG